MTDITALPKVAIPDQRTHFSGSIQAAQDDENPGVLILSPFAGAGGLMHEALMANPYETLNVATAVNR